MSKTTAVTLALLVSTATLTVYAQPSDRVPNPTRTFAIEGVTIVQAPGQEVENGIVVVRDGLIMDVGTDVAIPFDAERVSGDSLFVYAGFIDGLSNAGVPAPRSNTQGQASGTQQAQEDRPADPGNPPNERAGIQPDRSVTSVVKYDDKSIGGLREAGFTLTHTVPRGRMLPGTGALLSLNEAKPEEMIVRKDASLFVQFEGARGVYPNTPMGIMAKFRQMYREAGRQKAWQRSYGTGTSGMERPPNDPTHAAFFDVLDGATPVVFQTKSVLETHRALRLRDELGFSLMIAGADQAAEMVDALAGSNAPLFLSLKLPKEPGKKTKDGEGGRKGGADRDSVKADAEPVIAYDPSLRTSGPTDVEAEKKNLEARQKEVYARYVGAAGALADAGVPFGFTTIDVKPKDIHGNLRKMIEAGLDEDAALASLTVNPARILGLSATHGTVERGKTANLVVTVGPYFEEKSEIRYVFVDGNKFVYEPPEKSDDEDDDAAAFAGVWDLEVETPDGIIGAVLTLSGSGSNIDGTIASDVTPEVSISDVQRDGTTLTFRFDAAEYGMVEAILTVDGDGIEGTMTPHELDTAKVTGSRRARPDKH